jgi:hypothetical protein
LRNVRGVAHRRNCLCPPVPPPARPSTYLNLITSFFLRKTWLKINDPRGGTNFDPRAIIWTILVEVHFAKSHAIYLTSCLCQFREEDFSSFHFNTYKENYRLWGRAGNFNTRGIIKTTLVEDP